MKILFIIAAGIIFICHSHPSAIAAEGGIAVISKRLPKETMTEKMLGRIFLKRKVLWDDGSPIVPVNLPATHPVRNIFVRKILGMGHRQLVDYWNDQYFKGTLPPTVLESEEAVKMYVRQVEGAVGYIRMESMEPDLILLYTIKDE